MSQIVAAMLSPSSSQRTRAFQIEHRSPFLSRSRSLGFLNADTRKHKGHPLRRAVSASLDTFAHDEDDFVKKLQELVLQGDKDGFLLHLPLLNQESETTSSSFSSSCSKPWQGNRMGAPEWMDGERIGMPSSMERIANSVELPVSLRIIKQKKKNEQVGQWGGGLREVGECARSSVQKAFSSMVFMIRELQCYTLQMRQALLYEDVNGGVLGRVQNEMHASFVWLFQQIFSGTPTLMVSVMVLLANFTVYSMSHSVAAPLRPPESSIMAVVESSTATTTIHDDDEQMVCRTASVGVGVGGSGSGGGGKVRPVTGAKDEGPPCSSSSSCWNGIVEEGGSEEMGREGEEEAVWNGIVEEARELQLASLKDESLMDPHILKWLLPPVVVSIQTDDPSDYLETELNYHQAVKHDPHNSLLLSNFAHFLHLVLHDHHRAEYYYKKAVEIKPVDAEALNKYATFLWVAKNDVSAAEEIYLEALAADPGNTYYAANYAHFLWNTGGDDTCFPLGA